MAFSVGSLQSASREEDIFLRRLCEDNGITADQLRAAKNSIPTGELTIRSIIARLGPLLDAAAEKRRQEREKDALAAAEDLKADIAAAIERYTARLRQ